MIAKAFRTKAVRSYRTIAEAFRAKTVRVYRTIAKALGAKALHYRASRPGGRG